MMMCDVFRRVFSKSDTLQKLFLEVKLLELQLQYHLLLIHVPGTTMIREGIDGLSRGVFLQPPFHYEDNILLPLLWKAVFHFLPLSKLALHIIKAPWKSDAA